MQSKQKSVGKILRKLRKCEILLALQVDQNLSHRVILYQRLRMSLI